MTPTIHPLLYRCPHCSTAIEAHPQTDEQVVNCPACRQPFKLELPTAPASVADPCPPCPPPLTPGAGLPTPTPLTQAAAPAASPAASAVASAVADPPESPAETFHVSMVRRYPLRCAAYLAATAAAFVGGLWLLAEGYQVLAALCGLAFLFLMWRLVTWWLRMHNTTLAVTDRRCVIETGVFTREATEVARKDVSDVHVTQSGMMRLLNVGDLVIISNKGGRKEVVVMAVHDPDHVASRIAPPPSPQPAAEPAGTA